jgi:hypothetical protein
MIFYEDGIAALEWLRLSEIEEGPPGRRYRAEDLEGHRWVFFEIDHD